MKIWTIYALGDYFANLQIVADEHGMQDSKANYPDLHGPIEECRLLIVGSFSVFSDRERPMQLGLDGLFLSPAYKQLFIH